MQTRLELIHGNIMEAKVDAIVNPTDLVLSGGGGLDFVIRHFSKPGRVDVALIKDEDGTQTFAAIAECKGAGYEGNGRDQLKGYLSVTDTEFGIFANRTDPSQWEFYKKQGQNQCQQIPCDQFKQEVKRLTDPDLKAARKQVVTLETENNQLERIHQGLKVEFEKIKVFLTSAMQEVNEVSKKIDK